MQIFLSIGHGGETGAIANDTTEFIEAKKVGDQVLGMLRNAGVQATMIPQGLGLSSRINWVNYRSKNDDFLIELHLDSFTGDANGSTMFYFRGNDWAREQAELLLETYTRETGLKSRGAKGDDQTRHERLGIIARTNPVAFLLELGFISNKKDLEVIRRDSASAVTNIILQYMGKDGITDETVPTWAEEGHEFVVDNSISDGTRPNDVITRAEVWTMLERLYQITK